jgi:hypothetical protein
MTYLELTTELKWSLRAFTADHFEFSEKINQEASKWWNLHSQECAESEPQENEKYSLDDVHCQGSSWPAPKPSFFQQRLIKIIVW